MQNPVLISAQANCWIEKTLEGLFTWKQIEKKVAKAFEAIVLFNAWLILLLHERAGKPTKIYKWS